MRPLPSARIADVARHETGIDVQLELSDVPREALADDRVLFVERDKGGDARLRIYRGRIESSTRGQEFARVRAIESDEVKVLSAADSIFASNILASLDKDRFVAILPGIAGLGGTGVIIGTTWHYEDVALRIVQDGAARHALIIPMSDALAPTSLGGGQYRLTLTLDRARWSTTAPPDDVNRYHDSASAVFVL
jgi:hypothetical protein